MTKDVIYRKFVFRRPNCFIGVNPDVTQRWCISRSLPDRPPSDQNQRIWPQAGSTSDPACFHRLIISAGLLVVTRLASLWLNVKMIQRLIPKIFYNQLSEGLDLFVDCLGFQVLYRDENLAVVSRDGAKAYVVENAEYAAKDRPEIALETDTIHELFAEIKAKRPEMLHPNLNTIRRQPWGPLEFAVLDKTTVCVVFRQWPQ